MNDDSRGCLLGAAALIGIPLVIAGILQFFPPKPEVKHAELDAIIRTAVNSPATKTDGEKLEEAERKLRALESAVSDLSYQVALFEVSDWRNVVPEIRKCTREVEARADDVRAAIK